MKRVLKWLAYGLGGILGLVLIAVVAVFARSQWILSETWEVPADALTLSDGAQEQADVEEGERLARIYGCYNGCHGRSAEGGVFLDIPNVARLVAPSLAYRAAHASNAELVRSIRFGIKDDGTSVWAMPSAAFYHISDDQLASIIAFLRSLPEGEPVEEESAFRALARVAIAKGDFEPQPAITTEMPPRFGPEDASDPHALGRQLAITVCSECHGSDLQGNPLSQAPSLAVAQAYDAEAFHHLMNTGEALGGREVGLMSRVARGRFKHLTAEEMDALHAYLSETGGRDLVEDEEGG